MSIDHALWVHGHSAQIEFPDRLVSIVQKGYNIRIQGKPSTSNWLHFAVPSAVLVDDRRMRAMSILFRYKMESGARIDAVHVYDGEEKIAVDDNPTGSEDTDGWSRIHVKIDRDQVLWGIGISIGLGFGTHGGKIEFESAGCDFEVTNRVSPQRLEIRTNKRRLLEFPFRSNMPIDMPNEAIERILISLHGTGSNTDFYLSNGMAAVRKAVDTGVDPNAVSNTLIIAPQFIVPEDYYQGFAANLVYFGQGRPEGAESVERDLNGNGIPDSGTLSSFTIMDTLLERVCRPKLFPNLKIIVIAGHSLGGRFMSCYAAASPFEQEIATPRGVHVRYLVMGSGQYLYLDETRYAFSDDTYLQAADNDDWHSAVVTLNDFSTVCSQNPGAFNNWPSGLNDLLPYAAQVGAEQIRNQFGGRDVHYLVGEDDLSPSFEFCRERVQGQDTLAKTLLYFWHLEHHYAAALKHQLHVLSGVGHSSRGEMLSPQGLEALFAPAV